MIKYQIVTSRTGEEILEIDGIKLHSTYDPVKEANRFIARTFTEEENPVVIVISGAGSGYLLRALKEKYPRARILPLYYTSVIYDLRKEEHQPSWYPGTIESLSLFLREHISEFDIQGLKIIEWQPSIKIFPQAGKKINKILSYLLKEYSGNFFTTCAHGKIWIKNSFYNWLFQDNVVTIDWEKLNKPVFIAGSGPSLEETVPWIDKYRYKLSIWALPSAVDFLISRNIVPDFVIMTDPGYWSIPHLQKLKDKNLTVIMPLSGAKGIWQLGLKSAYIKQPNFFEQQLLDLKEIKSPEVNAMGTVAATAVELALNYTNKQIFVTGLDFCYQDIKSHATPNLFHKVLEQGTSKLNPLYNALYERARKSAPIKEGQQRTSTPLLTYAGWFQMLPESRKGRILKISSKINTKSQFFEVSGEHFKLLLEDIESKVRNITPLQELWPMGKERKKRAIEILNQWCNLLEEGKNKTIAQVIKSPLLFNLLYFTELSQLNKIYHRIAQKESPAIIPGKIIKDSLEFYKELKEKIKDASFEN